MPTWPRVAAVSAAVLGVGLVAGSAFDSEHAQVPVAIERCEARPDGMVGLAGQVQNDGDEPASFEIEATVTKNLGGVVKAAPMTVPFVLPHWSGGFSFVVISSTQHPACSAHATKLKGEPPSPRSR